MRCIFSMSRCQSSGREHNGLGTSWSDTIQTVVQNSNVIVTCLFFHDQKMHFISEGKLHFSCLIFKQPSSLCTYGFTKTARERVKVKGVDMSKWSMHTAHSPCKKIHVPHCKKKKQHEMATSGFHIKAQCKKITWIIMQGSHQCRQLSNREPGAINEGLRRHEVLDVRCAKIDWNSSCRCRAKKLDTSTHLMSFYIQPYNLWMKTCKLRLVVAQLGAYYYFATCDLILPASSGSSTFSVT